MKTRVDVARLRHPLERHVWWAAVLVNALLCVGAVVIVVRQGQWVFAEVPFLESYETQIRAIAVAAVLAPIALVFARNGRLARVRGGSVRVSESQHPGMHERFLAQCGTLGVEDPPALFVSDEVIDTPSHSYSAWRREYVVLSTDFLEADLEPLRDVWSFLLGREMGRLALGHVTWWDELLLAYVHRLPWVRRPLRHVRAYSLDQVGAFLEPEGVRGLVVQAAGRRPLPCTNVAEAIRHAVTVGGVWVRLSFVLDEEAHLAVRLRNLYDRGHFDLDRDLRRFEAPPAAERARVPGCG